MFIALALAAATTMLPPMTLSVHATTSVPAKIIKQTLDEAAAVLRESGVTLMAEDDDCAGGPTRFVPSVLIHVMFDDTVIPSRPYALPIGWIDFDEYGDPMRRVHLSLANATSLMEAAEGAANASRMTVFERNLRLSRALGRALAHELGHYLLSSKSHTKEGLMKAHHPAGDFLGVDRSAFEIDASQRALIAARLLRATTVSTMDMR